jgi:hypothetical protein
MQNILTLSSCQDRISSVKNHEKITNSINNGTIILSHELLERIVPSLEELSVSKAKKALMLTKQAISPKKALQILKNAESLKEAIRIFEERKQSKETLEKIIEQLPAHITDKPKFHEAKIEAVELSASVRETFARIGARARSAFAELQIERALELNIPYEQYGDNYYQLMIDIDRYEYLLKKAQGLGVDFDASEYDLVALEQAIEEAEHNAYMPDQELRGYFALTRGVEV